MLTNCLQSGSNYLVTQLSETYKITNTNTVYNHLLASTFLFHSTGVAAVKYSRFDLVKLMMEAKVPAPNALIPSYPFTLQHMAGCDHWGYDLLNQYLNSTWIYHQNISQQGVYRQQ